MKIEPKSITAAILAGLMGCDQAPEHDPVVAQAEARFVLERARFDAVLFVARLQYVKDTRTGICFAYAWGGGLVHGGPALAVVPCEKVEQLL